MATYSYRDIVTRTREYTVPAEAKWGACLGDMLAAINAARVAYVEANGLDPARAVTDDALRFFPGDDEIIISYAIREPK